MIIRLASYTYIDVRAVLMAFNIAVTMADAHESERHRFDKAKKYEAFLLVEVKKINFRRKIPSEQFTQTNRAL